MVTEGKFVQIEYTGTFENGEEFDSNVGGKPLEFKVGSGMIIPGIEKEVIGMKIDEEKEISIKPDDAYGEYDESHVHTMPIEEVKKDFDPQVGMTVVVGAENGGQIPAVISEITEESVIIDCNHPLAGKVLNFKFKLLAVNDEAQFPQDDCGCCSDSNDGCGDGCGDGGCC